MIGLRFLERCAKKMKLILWTAILGIASLAHGAPDEKEFNPPISAEQAAITARRVLTKHEFNPKAFEIRKIEWKRQIIPGPAKDDQAEGRITETHNQQLEALQKQFGNGPAWEVRFWRTKQVVDTGNWSDDIRFGLIVLVFDANRAALMDTRTNHVPEDKVETE